MTEAGNTQRRRGCGCLGIGSFGLGTVIAVVVSWTTWHDVLWTIVHGFLSWAFLIWYVATNQQAVF